MNIAILLGRGTEGCGVTRVTIEHQNWFRKNGHTCEVYTMIDKFKGKYVRTNSQENEFRVFKQEEACDVVKIIEDDKVDVVGYYSLPSVKYNDNAKDNFLKRLVKGIHKPKKIMFQFDHKKASLNRNYAMLEIASEMDLLFTHSLTSAFGKLINENKINVPLIKMSQGFDFNNLTKYRKDISQLEKKLTFFSRFGIFKDPLRMIKLFPYLRDLGFLCEMNGIEKSLAAMKLIYNIEIPIHHEYARLMQKYNLPKLRENLSLNELHIFGAYNRSVGLEQLSTSMFGCDFYNLEESAYGDMIEYAMLEIIGVGSIPIFDSHFGEHVFLKNTKTKLIDIPNFAIWSNKKDGYEDVANQMNEIYNSQKLIKQYRDTSLEVAMIHANQNDAMNEILKNINNINK